MSPWHVQIFAGCIIGAVSLGWIVYKKTNLVGGLLYFYCLLNSLYAFFKPDFRIKGFGPIIEFQVPAHSAQAALWLIMVVVPFIFVQHKYLKHIVWAFLAIGVLNSISVIFYLGVDDYKNSGIMLNGAQDGALIACLLPFVESVKKPYRWAITALFAVAIFRADATTPYVGVAVYLFIKLWFSRFRLLALAAPIVVAAMGAAFQGYTTFINPNSRDYIWKLSMNFFMDHINHFLGSGGGTFFIYGPVLELIKHGMGYNRKVFVWLHNEYLQILFEFGIIGLVLTLGFFALTAKKAYSRPQLFNTLMIFGVTAFTQMPLRQAVSAFFLVFLLKVIYEAQDVPVSKS